jgi:hypothetical protein
MFRPILILRLVLITTPAAALALSRTGGGAARRRAGGASRSWLAAAVSCAHFSRWPLRPVARRVAALRMLSSVGRRPIAGRPRSGRSRRFRDRRPQRRAEG